MVKQAGGASAPALASLPGEHSLDRMRGHARAAVQEDVGNSATEEADVLRLEHFAGVLHGVGQFVLGLEFVGIEPSALVAVFLANHAAPDLGPRVPLAPRGLADPCCEERTVRDVVGGQGVAREDDVIGLLYHDAHLALNLLEERRWRGLEARLHHHRRVVRIGQGLAVDACAGIDRAQTPFAAFIVVFAPALELPVLYEGLERGRGKQRCGVHHPLITDVRRELPAVGALAPPQATVREQILADADPQVRSVGLVVELSGGRDVHGLPDFAPPVLLVDPGSGHEVAELVVELHLVGRSSDVRDVGSFVEGAVRDELCPQPDRVPVHAHDAGVALYEVVQLEVVGPGLRRESPTRTLHPSAQLDREVAVVSQVRVLSGAGMPIDVGKRLDKQHQCPAGTDYALRREKRIPSVREPVAALVVHVQEVEEVDEFEAGLRFLRSGPGVALRDAPRADVDGGDQCRPVVEAAKLDDAFAKRVSVFPLPVGPHRLQLLGMNVCGRKRVLVDVLAIAEDLEEVAERRDPLFRRPLAEGVVNAGLEPLRPVGTGCESAQETPLDAPSCESRGMLSRRCPRTGRCVSRSSLLFAGGRNGDGA